MKIGLYTDPHFSQTSSIITGFTDEGSARLQTLVKSVLWANEVFKEKGCEKVICLGDLTDRPDLTAEEITALSKCNLESHTFLVGNHCRIDKNGKINSLSLLKEIVNIPTTMIFDDKKFLLLPYNSSLYEFKSDEFYDVILSHNDLYGYELTKGYLSTVGYTETDILDHCKLFINGHLHNGSWIIKDRILNLGAISGMNFASCGGDWEPSIGILDTDTLNIELIENPYAYRFKKLEFNKLAKLKEYLDNLPEIGQYALQIKVPEDIIDGARKLIKQNKKNIVATRFLIKRNNLKSKQVVSFKSDETIYTKLRNFLAKKTSEKGNEYSLDILNKIIDEIE